MSAVEHVLSEHPVSVVHFPRELSLGSQTRPWGGGGRLALLLDLLKLLCVLG